MKNILKNFLKVLLGISAFASVAFIYDQWDDWTRPAVYVGSVVEVGTNAPLANAYVLASYARNSSNLVHSVSKCVKTRGTWTDARGQFRFPNIDGLAIEVFAIKSDHFMVYRKNAQIFLARVGTQPYQRLRTFHCDLSDSAEDELANLEYLKLVHAEQLKHGSNPPPEALGESIKAMEEWMRQPATYK
jgi:hypothetical protein